jgi:hypothetical protein
MKQSASCAPCWFLGWLCLWRCKWRWSAPPKRRVTFARLHGVTSKIYSSWPPQIQHTGVCLLVLLIMTDHCMWHLTWNGKATMTVVLSQHLMEGLKYSQKNFGITEIWINIWTRDLLNMNQVPITMLQHLVRERQKCFISEYFPRVNLRRTI